MKRSAWLRRLRAQELQHFPTSARGTETKIADDDVAWGTRQCIVGAVAARRAVRLQHADTDICPRAIRASTRVHAVEAVRAVRAGKYNASLESHANLRYDGAIGARRPQCVQIVIGTPEEAHDVLSPRALVGPAVVLGVATRAQVGPNIAAPIAPVKRRCAVV